MTTPTREDRPQSRREGTVVFKAHHLIDRVPDPGWYRLGIVGAYQRATEQRSLAVKVRFEIIDESDWAGVECWDQFVIDGTSDEGADVALRRLARLYRACGLQVKPDTEYEVAQLQGREILGRIVPDTFQGQVRARVRAFRPVPNRTANTAAPESEEPTPF